MPQRILHRPADSSATVPLPAFPLPDPKCSNGSIGRPDPRPPSDGRDWAEALLADALLQLAPTAFASSFSFSFPTSSASTSFVSRCTGPATAPASRRFTLLCRIAMHLQGRSPYPL